MIPRLLAITPPEGPVSTACVDAGASLAVLLRAPDPRDALHGPRLGPLRQAAVRNGMPMLLSCSPSDALRLAAEARDAGLAGVQLRGDPGDDAVVAVRTAWPEAVVGASVHGEPRTCAADYVVFAPVFAPRTPAPFPKPAAGLAALASWTRVHHRVFALGGVTEATAAACVEHGAFGLAGLSTFFGDDAAALRRRLGVLARTLSPRTDARAPSDL